MRMLRNIQSSLRPKSDVAYARWVLVMLALAFPMWGSILQSQVELALDPLVARMVVSAIALAVVGGSFAQETPSRDVHAYVAFTWTIASMISVWLAWANPTSDGYTLQLLAILGSGGLVIRDLQHVRWYWTGVLGALALAVTWKEVMPTHVVFLTITSLSLLILHAIVGVREQVLQDQIIERTTLLREVFENATDALFLVDPGSRQVLLANQRAMEMFAAPVLDALLDRDVFDFPARPLQEDEVAAIFEASHGDGEYRMEVPFRRFEGSPFWGDAAWRSIDMGNRRWTLLRITRIDERIRAQRALERARDAAEAATVAKSNFLANMSHEIRTPLNGVLGLASLLERTELTPDQTAYVSTIITSGRTLLSLIDELLDFSRIEAGELVVVEEAFELDRCLDDLKLLFRQQAESKSLDLSFELAPNVPTRVLTDGTRLRQVIVNLLGNAIKFTASGSVSLACEVTDRTADRLWIAFKVTDTGIGIQEDEIPKLFEPFHQGDPGITRKFGGTGLGLAISKRIAERLGGTLSVTSTPGQGSTFSFTVGVRALAAPGHGALLPDATGQVPVDGKRPVLVAEDNPVNRMVILEMLRRMGCDAEAVSDGAAAVERIQQRTYDVVLMDVMMPGMDGLEATRRIRKLKLARRPYIAALTAGVLPGDRDRCVEAGMDDFMAKPIQMEDVRRLLQRALVMSTADDVTST